MAHEAISSGPASIGTPSHRPVLAVVAVVLGAFIHSLDTRRLSIGLPNLRGAFGLTLDEGSWLSTAATAPQILIAPAIAWLATVFGQRRVLIRPSLVYIAISLLIPLARDYPTLLVLHIVHSLLPGVFIPVTIMIVLRNLPMRWWIVGLAAYSFRLSFTSNVGLWVVGYYVQELGWQWLYWQNAIIALLMMVMTILGTPRETINHQLLAKADWSGMLLLGAGLALIYAGLDQGNRLDWFESGTVIALLAGGAALLVCFLVNEAVVAKPWASPAMLKSRNVLLAMAAMITYMITSLSNTLLVPTFFVAVARLRPEQTGSLLLLYTALPICVVMLVAIYLLRRIDAQFVVICGLTSFAVAAWMGTRITGEWALGDFIPIALLQALGQGLTFTALLIFVLANSDPARATAFVAYIQVMRLNMIEITVTGMNTWLRVREQVHSNLVGLDVSAGDSDVAQRLAQLTRHFLDYGAAPQMASARAMATLARMVRRQADVLSIIDGFTVSFWGAIAGLLLVSLMRAAPPGPLTPGGIPAKARQAH